MLDRPDVAELLAAVAAFLEEQVVPASSGRRRFHALVAANATRIAERELVEGPRLLDEEVRELWVLLGRRGDPPVGAERRALALELSSQLCSRIESGDADDGDWRGCVIGHLKRSIARRLAIDNPKFAR